MEEEETLQLREHRAECLHGPLRGDDQCAVAVVIGGRVEFAGDDESFEGGGVGVVVVQGGDVDRVKGDDGVAVGWLEGVGGEVDSVGVVGAGFRLEE